MVSATGIASVLLIIAGISIAVLQVNKKSYEVQNANRVATPSFGSSHKEGPWPECRGMDGDACCKLIESYASDVQGNCRVISERTPVTMDFRTDRVRVVVDDQNIVVQIPNRG